MPHYLYCKIHKEQTPKTKKTKTGIKENQALHVQNEDLFVQLLCVNASTVFIPFNIKINVLPYCAGLK